MVCQIDEKIKQNVKVTRASVNEETGYRTQASGSC